MNPQSQKIRIGWAKKDITPAKPASLMGQFYVRISEYVNDPLLATALAIESEDKSQQMIMVSVDAVHIRNSVRDKSREMLKEKLKEFDTSMLIINATHTHTAPLQEQGFYPHPDSKDILSADEYFEMLVNGIVEAAIEAWENKKLGAVSWGYGYADVGFNRRAVYLDGSAQMYGQTDVPNFSHIEGYEDHAIEMMFTYGNNKELTGMILNVACPSQVTESERFVSADYWNEVRSEIKSRYGGNIFVLPQCSAAGDQSPHPMFRKQAQVRMLELKGLLDNDRQLRMAERIEIGKRIANAVDDVLPYASKDIRAEVPFVHKNITLKLPRRLVSEDELKSAKELVKTYECQLGQAKHNPTDNDYAYKYIQVRRFRDVIERYERQKTDKALSTEVHIIRLGDIAFATNRFELFLDYGIRIKARSKAVQTFVVQLAGEASYLPTERALNAKSYGAGIESNLVGPEGGQMLVDESVNAINEIFGE